jgi:hypothetical protein
MNPDLTWHLQVLDKIRGHYIALVERKVLPPGLCWLLKPSKSVSKKHPNIASILELANMTTQECNLFWKPFVRKYGDKVQEHFGAEAFVRPFGGDPVIIFKTKPMNPLHESPAGDRLELLSMASHFSIRLPEKPIELSEPPSPRRSPRHHAAPLSPSKRCGSVELRQQLFVDTSGSPPKRSRTETPMNFNSMKILKEHVKIVDGWPHLSHYYSAAPVTTKETSKNFLARRVVSAIDKILSKRQASFTQEVQSMVAAAAALNPHISIPGTRFVL